MRDIYISVSLLMRSWLSTFAWWASERTERAR